MLDQIALPAAVLAHVSHNLAYCVELMVAWEDDALLLALDFFARSVFLGLLLYLEVEKLLDDVEQAILLQRDLP